MYELILCINNINSNSYWNFSYLWIHIRRKYEFILDGNMNSHSYFSNLWIHTTREYEFILIFLKHMNSYYTSVWIHITRKYEFIAIILRPMNSYLRLIWIHTSKYEFILNGDMNSYYLRWIHIIYKDFVIHFNKINLI